jgi:hypothetical protein
MFDEPKMPQQPTLPQPPNSAYDPFSQIGQAEVSVQGVYAAPGVYPVLYLDNMKMIESRKHDILFVAEFDILKSEVPSRPAGSRISYIVNFRHDAGPGNVKEFIATLMDVSPQEVDENTARIACSEKNPCRGRLIRLEAILTTTRTGNDFTIHRWTVIQEEIQTQAEKLRESAGFTPF